MTAKQMVEQIRRMTPVAVPQRDQRDVAALSRLLTSSANVRSRHPQQYKLVSADGDEVVLPESVFFVLERVAEVLARGDSITVVPVGKELTTQQAADLLNVSRQYLVRLLDAGELPHSKTGKHRRLRIEDVLAFKAKRDAARQQALDDLAAVTQEFGGYERELK